MKKNKKEKVKYTFVDEWTCRDGSFRASKKMLVDPIKLYDKNRLVDRAGKTAYRHCGWTDSSTYDLSNDPEYKGWKIQIEREN